MNQNNPHKTAISKVPVPFVGDFLPYLLSHSHSRLWNGLLPLILEKSVSINEFKVLTTLVGSDGLSLRQLAEMMQIKQSTLSRIVETMVVSKLLSRQDATKDRRRIEIRLTKKGLNQVKPLLEIIKKTEQMVEFVLGTEDANSLKRILNKLINEDKSIGIYNRE
jgi:DNA-binding MarR family transcriptional regulator